MSGHQTPHLGSDLSHSRDNTGSLTHGPTSGTRGFPFFFTRVLGFGFHEDSVVGRGGAGEEESQSGLGPLRLAFCEARGTKLQGLACAEAWAQLGCTPGPREGTRRSPVLRGLCGYRGPGF